MNVLLNINSNNLVKLITKLVGMFININRGFTDLKFNNDFIINELLGKNAKLTRLQKMMVVALHKSGGMNGEELKVALGYAPDAATHTVDTAIYQLRKIYGHEFIKNDCGVYKIGKL